MSTPVPGDDLGLSSEEWMDLRVAYNFGTIEPREGTIEQAAFGLFDAQNHADALRAWEAEQAEEAWRQGAIPSQAAPDPSERQSSAIHRLHSKGIEPEPLPQGWHARVQYEPTAFDLGTEAEAG